MPYRISPSNPKCVDHKTPGGNWEKKGCSTSVQGAKDYLNVLNMRHAGIPAKGARGGGRGKK